MTYLNEIQHKHVLDEIQESTPWLPKKHPLACLNNQRLSRKFCENNEIRGKVLEVLNHPIRAVLESLGCNPASTDMVMENLQFKKLQNRSIPCKDDEVKIFCPVCKKTME